MGLIDAQEMHKEHPEKFDVPSNAELRTVRVGDFVKIAAESERFWVEIIGFKDDFIRGRINNDLKLTAKHGLSAEDTILFERRHIHQVAFEFGVDQIIIHRGRQEIGRIERKAKIVSSADPIWFVRFGRRPVEFYRASKLIPAPEDCCIPNTPELDRFIKVTKQYDIIMKFLDWFTDAREPLGVLLELAGDVINKAYASISADRLLAEYFDIDLDKIELERRAIIEQQRNIDKLFED